MNIKFNHMGPQGDKIRVDVYIDDSYVGELSVRPEEWNRLIDASDDGSVEVEANE